MSLSGRADDRQFRDETITCRCDAGVKNPLLSFSLQGGNNAGHTVKVGGVVYDFHLLPRWVCALVLYVHTH